MKMAEVADGWPKGRRAGRATLAKHQYAKCFRLVMKSKPNARRFGEETLVILEIVLG